MGAGEDLVDGGGFGVGVGLDVVPGVGGEVAFCFGVVGAVGGVLAEPVAEEEYAVDLDFAGVGGEDVEVDVVGGAGFGAAAEEAVVVPVGFADAEFVADVLEGGYVGGFVGGVGHKEEYVNYGLGGEVGD